MNIPVKTDNTIKKEVGDIKRSPAFISRKHKKSGAKSAFLFFAGCFVGFIIAFGFNVFKDSANIENLIMDDFAAAYTFDVGDIMENPTGVANMAKIQYVAEEAGRIFKNSGIDAKTLNGFIGGNARWFFQGGESLVLVPKNEKTKNGIKVLFNDIEREIKKEFNISSVIYRNYEITQFSPAKNSRFTRSVFYAIGDDNILISDNATFIRNAIDKALENGWW